jgi:hypothetical protein
MIIYNLAKCVKPKILMRFFNLLNKFELVIY